MKPAAFMAMLGRTCGRFLWRAQNWLAAFSLLALILVGIRLWPHPALAHWKPLSVAVYDSKGRLLRLALASDDRYRVWVPLKDEPRELVEAVLMHEDRWFYWHPGFNPYGLARGAWVTYVRHGARQGGSTITMQLARLLWPINSRTPMGKAEQLLRAEQLELFYSKSAILEAYLNFAPYGRNVEGAGAASLAYFGKPPRALSLPEALTLAVIPQNPARSLRQRQDIIAEKLRAPRNRLFVRWLRTHPEDASLKPLFALPLTIRPLSSLPFLAPHAVEQVLQEARGGDPSSAITTTLDLDLQRVLETQIRLYVTHGKDTGIRNASAVLVDTRDMGVKALVGSADYFDQTLPGQVNGTLARRSPGSTLKPFIYALGFDQGVLHPQTVLRDVPTSFGPYTPENFDGRFLGPLTATDALNRSRNIPAVWVASQLHAPDFYQFLESAGIGHLASEQHYGLALVLGGGEVSMQELASLYAMLANHGRLKPLRLVVGEPSSGGTQLISAEASFMVMDMLRQHVRPDETTGAQPLNRAVYWKTGTSWSFRDAWTAGVFGHYVLVVWVGNFDGSSNQAFVGIDAAAPLFFRIVDAVSADDPHMGELALRPPANVKRVEVCLASGELPNQWCPQRGMTWFIPGKSPIRVSAIHRALTIDDATELPACPPYAGKHVHQEVFEFWPSDLQEVFAEAGIPRRKPPHAPDCVGAGMIETTPLTITSPLRGSAYELELSRPERRSVAFNAVADADSRSIFWFVDSGYVGSAAPGHALYWTPPSAGHYEIRAVDDRGNSDARVLEVGVVR